MRLRLKLPALRLFTQPFIRAKIKENIKAPRHWHLCGEFTGDRWIPRTNGQCRGKSFYWMTSSCQDVWPLFALCCVLFCQFHPHPSGLLYSWWRHQMATVSASLALCVRNSQVIGEFPAQRPMTRSFDVFFDLRLNKRLSKQSWRWRYATPSRSFWRHSNVVLRQSYYMVDLVLVK